MRYLKASVLIGTVTAASILALARTGPFAAVDARLLSFFPAGLSAAPDSIHIGLVIVISLLVAWMTVDVVRFSLKIALALLVLLEIPIATVVLAQFGLWFPPIAAVAAVVTAATLSLVYAASPAGRRKAVLEGAVGSRVSPATFRALLNRKEGLPASGTRQQATIVTCRTIAQSAESPEANQRLLSEAAAILVNAGGYMEGADPESVRVVFGLPLSDETHAVTACGAVLDVLSRIPEGIQAGIESGEVVVAGHPISGDTRLRVSGTPVATSQSLVAANAEYGSRAIVGPGAFAAAGEAVVVRPLDFIRRKDEAYEIYEPLALASAASEELLARSEAFWRGIILVREHDWTNATAAFSEAQTPDTPDPVITHLLSKIAQAEQGEDSKTV